MEIKERIRDARKNAGMTQKALSEATGIAEISIRNYEAGKRKPQSEQLKALARALDVTTDYLLGVTYTPVTVDDGDGTPPYRATVVNVPPDYWSTGQDKETVLLDHFHTLNDTGQDKAVDYTETLTKVPEYKKEGQR